MPICKFILRKHRKVCVGDLNTLIFIQTRDIVEPEFNSVDFDEDFEQFPEEGRWALIETVTGKTVFDGVSTDVNITHLITIRFDIEVTSETWVGMDRFSKEFMLRINFVENLEERNEWQLLYCTERGEDKDASKA